MAVKPGTFITIEGGEGAGKTTLISHLHRELSSQGFSVITTREPGGCALADALRILLLTPPEGVSPSDRAELFLFLAARAQHIDEVIVPALEEGKIVICDRFNDSTVAYQGYARGFGPERVRALCLEASGGREPDLTLYLDIPPEIGLARTVGDLDRIEQEKIAFHHIIREGFQEITAQNPNRVHVLDATQTAAVVAAKATQIVLESCYAD